MVKNQATAVFVLFSLVFMTVTSGRYFQETDDRDKRQIGDLRTAEYLALITINNMLRRPSHCAQVGCGLINIRESGRRKKRSLDTVFQDLNDNEKLTLLDILMSRDADQLS